VARHDDGVVQRFMELIDSTPALTDYAQRMWLRHEDALIEVIAAELNQDPPSLEVRADARFVMQLQLLVLGSREPHATLDAAFRVLDDGWTAYVEGTAVGRRPAQRPEAPAPRGAGSRSPAAAARRAMVPRSSFAVGSHVV